MSLGIRKKRKYLRALFIFLFFSLPIYSFSQENGRQGLSAIGSETLSSIDEHGVLEKIKLLAFYAVEEGKTRILFYKKDDLRPGQELEIKGYVSGVVVLCKDEVEAGLDGIPMNRICEDDNGTLTCKYFGPLDSMESIFPYAESASPKPAGNRKSGKRTSKYLFGGYSYFPKVLGDGVSRKDRFSISLKKGEASVEIPVRQQGYRTIFQFQPGTAEDVVFQYQGTSLADRFAEEADLRQRLSAISEGIRMVEERFDMDLVDRVNLVDYEKIRNAFTCEGEKEIWFYIEALKEEPLDELKTIAVHETLHLLVDRQGFANDSKVREHFADLKGFDIFSYERFILITRGIVLDEESEKDPTQNAKFFSFISERNFLEGMKGGHAHQNPDEFCTSFLHSLMFVERLMDNLDRPLLLGDHQKPRILTQKEKREVLNEYTRAIEILRRSVSRDKESSGRAILDFLQQAQLQARREWKKGVNQAENAGVRVSGADHPAF